MKKLKYLFFAASILFILPSTSVYGQKKKDQKVSENSLFWEISGKGLKKPSYMFGTYHLLNDTYLSELPNVKKAFENASGVVVEMVIDSSKLMSLGMLSVMTETTLDKLVSPEVFEKLKEVVTNTLGPQVAMAMNMLKPNAVMAPLVMAYNREYNSEILNKYPGVPLDLFFSSDAKKRGIPVIGLESMEDQFKVLYTRQPVEKQAESLVKLVEDKDMVIKMQTDLLQFYLANDLEQLNKMYDEYSDKYGESDYLLKDRNIRWMEVFPDILAKGNQFIGVGALHLPGEFGMITLLRKAGYTVRPLSGK
ncbi:MAG: TraB/GumN family protein [Flavobacteriales bacterium]